MGDILQSAPLIKGLKDKYPDSVIHFLANHSFAKICSMLPCIDEVKTLDIKEFGLMLLEKEVSLIRNYNFICDFLNRLRLEKYDLVINLTHSKMSAIMTGLIKSRDTRGFTMDEEGHRIIKNPWIIYFANVATTKDFNQFNIVDIYTCCGGIMPSKKKLFTELTQEDEKSAESLLLENGIGTDELLIGFQPGASQAHKQWDVNSFAELGDTLVRELGAKIIVFGSGNEKHLGSGLQKLMKEDFLDMTGKTSITELSALLKKCRLLITNDTGTMHIATAVKTKVIEFSLGPAHFEETGPYSEGNIVLNPNIPCIPCSFHVECRDMVCKKCIEPQDVFKITKLLLSKEGKRLLPASRSFLNINPKVDVYYSTFDKENFLYFLPLARRPFEKKDFWNFVYRMMWKIFLKGNLAVSDIEQEMDRILNHFDLYGIRDFLGKIKTEQMAFKNIEELSLNGIHLSEQLIRLAARPEFNINLIERIRDSLLKLLEDIKLHGFTNRICMPLIQYFNYERESLEGNEILTLAKKTLEIYKGLHYRTKMMLAIAATATKVISIRDTGQDKAVA